MQKSRTKQKQRQNNTLHDSAILFLAWRNAQKGRTFAEANAFIAREMDRMRTNLDMRRFMTKPWHKNYLP